MVIKTNPILYLSLFIIIISSIPWSMKAHNNNNKSCERTCGSKHGPSVTVQFPFGFSEACEIQLECSSVSGKAKLAGYPVKSLSSEGIQINLKRRCDRSLSKAVESLFGRNYAPTSRNAILLENCTDVGAPCEIPSILVETHFSSLSCGGDKSSVSCYSESNESAFIDPVKLGRRKCGFMLSSISADGWEGPISLAVEVAELGWWVHGDCLCSDNANCTVVVPPRGAPKGFRCRCNQGFVGDGFRDGLGCRREHSKCSSARFLSGKCGGRERVVTLIAAIAVGVSLTVTLCTVTCCFLRRRAKQKARQLTKRRLSEATGNLKVQIYRYKDIEKATNGFSDEYRLGTGAYGTVYAGKLNGSDEWVAIKRIRHRGDSDTIEQVVNEIRLISSINHPNLVRLLGCSIDYNEQILVYEFMPNGTLSQHLQRERGDGIPWLVRLMIAMETANAIAHLHSDSKFPIYHRDVKSSNILLDHSFRSKVADFGLSRLGIAETSHISTAPQGTPGYLDPQYHQEFHLSDKSDVYSFGVVLVEIITGLKAVDFSRPQSDVNLASLAVDRIGKGQLDEIVDPVVLLGGDTWTISSVRKVAELAFRCLAFHRDMRPAMAEVATELEEIRRSKSTWQVENTSSDQGCFSSSASSSNVSDRPLATTCQGHESKLGKEIVRSPSSVQHYWPSQHSSPYSSNTFVADSSSFSN